MAITKVDIAPGVNREDTRYGGKGTWYECDNVRFRQGKPEKIGGWTRSGVNTFLGICRSIWRWSLLSGETLRGIGTDVKFYIDSATTYMDVTPLRATTVLTNPFETSSGSSTVIVTDAAGGFIDGDYVTFSGATAVGGLTIDGEYVISLNVDGTYDIDAGSNAGSSTTGGGTVTAEYQINVGESVDATMTGWGAGPWGGASWGSGNSGNVSLRIWNQSNFGQDLIAGSQGGPLYIWKASSGLMSRMTPLADEIGAADVPIIHDLLLISDVSRFVFVFGTNNICGDDYDPMLVRWSDQEDATVWTPLATNQAGSLRLSRGSKIVAVKQSRQEMLVWTDLALYSLQYYGAPEVWGAQLVGENISITSSRSVAYSNGISYWMGENKFYMYDGRTQLLPCDLRRYIFNDFNHDQEGQLFSGTNEAFHEIWWFYCSSGSTTVDSYVIFNYAEGIWYYGSMARTAWLDAAGGHANPIASTYNNKLVLHEDGIDDAETGSDVAISAYILSSQFAIVDGDRFSFIRKVIPDVSFEGSTAASPVVDMTLYPLHDSGSGHNSPLSAGGVATDDVTRTSTVTVEQYTPQLDIRVRGRQLSVRLSSDSIGVQWQLGTPRVDIRPDGRR